MVDRDALLADLQRVAEKLGHPPNATEYNEHGAWSTYPIYEYWAHWNDALRAADLEPREHRITDTELKQDLRRVRDAVGHAPTQAEYDEHGEHARETIRLRWGSWRAALREAGVLDAEGRTQWDDSQP